MQVNNRDVDFARLRMLNPKLVGELMSATEAMAVATHLRATVPQISQMLCLVLGHATRNAETGQIAYNTDAVTTEDIRKLLMSCPIVDLKRKSDEPERPTADDYIYRREKGTSTCTLILNGRVAVLAGKDGFRAEVGAWTTLAADALLQIEGAGPFVPDFSAFILSDNLRCMHISSSSAQALLTTSSAASSSATTAAAASSSAAAVAAANGAAADPHAHASPLMAMASRKSGDQWAITSADRGGAYASAGQESESDLQMALSPQFVVRRTRERRSGGTPRAQHTTGTTSGDRSRQRSGDPKRGWRTQKQVSVMMMSLVLFYIFLFEISYDMLMSLYGLTASAQYSIRLSAKQIPMCARLYFEPAA